MSTSVDKRYEEEGTIDLAPAVAEALTGAFLDNETRIKMLNGIYDEEYVAVGLRNFLEFQHGEAVDGGFSMTASSFALRAVYIRYEDTCVTNWINQLMCRADVCINAVLEDAVPAFGEGDKDA